jgi:hypothetical protein
VDEVVPLCRVRVVVVCFGCVFVLADGMAGPASAFHVYVDMRLHLVFVMVVLDGLLSHSPCLPCGVVCLFCACFVHVCM